MTTDAVRVEVLSEVGRKLRDFSTERRREHGVRDQRAAALWDAACYVIEVMGDGNWRSEGEWTP